MEKSGNIPEPIMSSLENLKSDDTKVYSTCAIFVFI